MKYKIQEFAFRLRRKLNKRNYNAYMKYEDRNSIDLPKIEKEPLISIILYITDRYEEMLNSLKNQANYTNYEIIAVSDRENYCEASVVITEKGCDRDTAFQTGLDIARGEYVAFADEDMIFEENAIYYMARQTLYEDYDIIYCDEDIIEGGERKNPFFKPGWSPDTLRSFNYIGFALIKKDIIEEFDSYYSLLCNISYKNIKAVNTQRILIHYKKRIMEEGKTPVYKGKGLVSIIIPSKDNYDVLKRCIESIRNKTEYKKYEIIVTDNGSSEDTSEKVMELADKYIYEKCEFNFSKMCNKGAERADGDFLLFLNDDIEIADNNWLDTMLAYCDMPQRGAVGCKLLYPDNNRIQHTGIINIKNGPVHCFQGFNDDNDLYFGRNRYAYNYSAVTGACLLISKDKFKGFDEELAVAYNDVDICLSLVGDGLYNVVVNSVKMYHYESLSRGDDRKNINKLKRLYAERIKLNKNHSHMCYIDKFYNRNLTQHRADFTIEDSIYINRGKFGKAVLNPQKYINTEIKAEIEYIKNGDMAEIGGYAYIEGKITNVYVLIMTRDNVAVPVKANAELRPDVSDKNALCGFTAVINTCMFEQGHYKLGIMLTDKFTFKKYTAITDDEIHIL